MMLLPLILVGSTTLVVLAYYGSPHFEHRPPYVKSFDVFENVLLFLIIGTIMFVPWMFVFGNAVDSTMSNEQKFSGNQECDTLAEEQPIGRVVDTADDGSSICSPSWVVFVGYFASGIATYLLCWRGGIALMKSYVRLSKYNSQ